MAFLKEQVRQPKDFARKEVADRITLEHELVRNPNGCVLIPEGVCKQMDNEFEAFDIEMARAKKEAQAQLVSDADVQPKPAASQKKRQLYPFRRCVRVFQPEDLHRMKDIAKSLPNEVKKRIEAGVKAAEANDGFRQVPSFKGIDRVLARVQHKFGNFAKVLEHMTGEMTLAGASKPQSFRINPILLDGPPAVGKTTFAQNIASTLDLPFRKLSAGGMQHAFVLTGSASHWGNSQTGEVYNMIGRSTSACGVLLIDEVDKISDRKDYAILPALLDLLEPETARGYVEESLGLVFDASRLIILMTSNKVSDIDAALLSRCSVFSIDAPGPEQKVLIAKSEHDKRNAGLPRNRRLELDIEAVQKLAENNIDIRVLIQAVSKGFATALMHGKKVVSPVFDDTNLTVKHHQMGFLSESKLTH